MPLSSHLYDDQQERITRSYTLSAVVAPFFTE